MKEFCFHIADATKSVIYGSEPPAVLDSDKFSEISLDQPVDAEPTTSQQEYNPLQNLDTFSPVTSHEQQRQQQQQQLQQRDETLFNPLAQAAAIKDSLSQLPGVASSVFSSFSNILTGKISPHPSGAESYPPSNTSTFPKQYPEEEQEISPANQYPYFYDQTGQQQLEAPAVVPTFYSPTDPNILRPEASLSPSSLSEAQSSNLYRLKERKKFYAPIPGLNANNSNFIPPNPSASPALAQAPNFTPSPAAPNQNTSFSLSSFFSGAPLLDKVLPKQPDKSANTNQDTVTDAHQSSFNTSNQEDSRPAQFFDLNQFGTSNSEPPFDISVTPSQIVAPASNQPVRNVSSNSFNLNPFQKASAPVQTSTPPLSSTTQPFNASAPPLPLNFTHFEASNIPQSVGTSLPPQPQFYNPNSPSNTPLLQPVGLEQPTPPAPTSDPFNQKLFQSPPTPQKPSASTSPALAQQAPIPTSYLPQKPAPPAGQAVNYRLQGRPHYKKPIQSPASLFNPASVPPSAPASNLQIFNPLTFDSTQQPFGQVPSAQIPTDQPVHVQAAHSRSVAPPPVNVFTPISQAPLQSTDNLTQYESKPESVAFSQPDQVPLHPIQSVFQLDSVPTLPVSVSTVINRGPSQSIDHPTQPESLSQPISVGPPPLSGFTLFNPAPFHQQQSLSHTGSVPTAPVSVFTPISQTPPLQSVDHSAAPPETQQTSIGRPLVSLPTQAQTRFEENSSPQTASRSINLGHDSLTSETQPNISSQNIIQSVPLNVNTNSVTNTELESSAQGSFFGDEKTEESSENKSQSNIESTSPFGTNPIIPIINPPTIQNFFEAAPFNPFLDTQNTYNLDIKTENVLTENENIENVNSAVKSLSLDKENNFIGESVVQSSDTSVRGASETEAFDPISFFNNNTIEPTPRDSSNPTEFQIQNFFNDPPPLSELQENVQEKNFNFIRTNLLNKRIERIANAETASPETLSVTSILAEAGSSAQSETSYAELQSTDVTSQSLQSSLDNNQVIRIRSYLEIYLLLLLIFE